MESFPFLQNQTTDSPLPLLNLLLPPPNSSPPLEPETPPQRSALYPTSKKINKLTSPSSSFKQPDTKIPRKLWTSHEDALLLKLVEQHGTKWTQIGRMIGGRSCKQVRDRYNNSLKPDINRNPFTPEEDKKVVLLYSQLGAKWKLIAGQLERRTEIQVKNRFYLCLRDSKEMIEAAKSAQKNLGVGKIDSSASVSTNGTEGVRGEDGEVEIEVSTKVENKELCFIRYNEDHFKQIDFFSKNNKDNNG